MHLKLQIIKTVQRHVFINQTVKMPMPFENKTNCFMIKKECANKIEFEIASKVCRD